MRAHLVRDLPRRGAVRSLLQRPPAARVSVHPELAILSLADPPADAAHCLDLGARVGGARGAPWEAPAPFNAEQSVVKA
jgi:hypothetical protein